MAKLDRDDLFGPHLISGHFPDSSIHFNDEGDPHVKRILLHLVKSGRGCARDRCRYYWSRKDVQGSLSRLLRNLSRKPIPATLISQYLPVQYERIRNGELSADPEGLIKNRIGDVLTGYFRACYPL